MPAAAAGAMAGRRVVAGIRPEHLAPGAAGEASLAGTLEMVEQLGADSLLHLAREGTTIVARVPHGAYPAIGATMHVAVDPARVHLFDASTGVRIP